MKDVSKNVILVIGNGFDIANGYMTRYGDFLSFVKNKDYLKYDDVEVKEEFERISNSNSFVKHFINLNIILETWVDVESEMKNIIETIAMVFKDESTYFETYISGGASINVNNQYKENIIEEFEFNDNSGFLCEKYYSDVYGINRKNITDHLNKQLNEFKLLLIYYLKYYMPKLGGTCKNIKQLLSIKPDHIISFNYTDYYKDYYDCKNIIHIHGKIENNEIVLGYENDDDENNVDYVEFKKYYQRLQYKYKQLPEKMFNEKYTVEKLIGFLDKKNIVHVYGMSLDATDKDTITYIYSKANKFIVYYYNEDAYNDILKNLIKMLGSKTINDDFSKEKLMFIKTDYETDCNV